MAFTIPLAFVLDCFVKKETVKGIIGKTHGVNNAAKPLKNAIKNKAHIDFPDDVPSDDFDSSVNELSISDPSTPSISKENSSASGGKHCVLSQVI